MINELRSLAEILSDVKISLTADHHTRKDIPKDDCFRVWLDNYGDISDIESLSAEYVKTLSKFGDNQSTFSAFNIAPLYRVSSDTGKDIIKSMRLGNVDTNALKALCTSDNWSNNLLNKINLCLHKQFPNMQKCPIVDELLNICKTIDASNFRASFERIVWKKLEDKIDTGSWLSLLIFEGNPKKDDKLEKDSGTLSIILDLLDWEKHGNPVASKVTANLMNGILVEADKESAAGKQCNKSRDAFGSEYHDIGQTMPSVRIIPGFNVALRAMFREQHCQFRYKNADDRSYPITLENRRL